MATNIPLSQIMGKMQSKNAMSPGSLYYGRRRALKGHYSGYGPKVTAQLLAGTLGTNYTPPNIAETTNGTAATTDTTGTALSPQDIAAQKLAEALRGQGVNWDYTPGQGQPYAPPASLIGGTAWRRIQNMPSLYKLLLDAAAASGVGNKSQADYLAEIGLFQHTGPQYSTLRYAY